MAVISTVLLLLAGLCICQANVVQLTNENFDSVSFFSDFLSRRFLANYQCTLTAVSDYDWTKQWSLKAAK